MAVTQYVGARYVPLFSEPLDWDIAKEYEPLTIVYYAGNSYTSRQAVPKGIEITDEKFWALTGNYNAQIEQYRKEVAAYDAKIKANATAIANETTRAKAAESANATAIANETTRAKAAESANATAIANETTRAKAAESANATAIANETTRAKAAENVINKDGWVTESRLDDGLKEAYNQFVYNSSHNEHVTQKASEARIYIAAISGDDENDGYSADSPVKTIEKAIEQAAKKQLSVIYFTFVENGDYVFDGENVEFSNAQLHFLTEKNVTSAMLTFDGNLRVYNTYVNFSSDTTNQYALTVNFKQRFHCDFCSVYFYRVKINFNKNDSYYCNFWFDGTKITANDTITMYQSYYRFSTSTEINSNNNGNRVLYSRSANVTMEDGITINLKWNPSSYAGDAGPFRFDDSKVVLSTGNWNVSGNNGSKIPSSKYGLHFNRSFAVVSDAAKTAFSNVIEASGTITGGYSVITNKSANQIFSA